MSNEILIQILAAFLFTLGTLIVLLRKDSIIVLMGIELMLNAANLSLAAFSHHYQLIDGQMQVFFVITLAAAESAVGLSILVNLYRNFGSIRTDVASTLKG